MAHSSCDFKSFHATPRGFALWTGPHGQAGKVIIIRTSLPGWVRRWYRYRPRRVAGRDCSRQAPSERHVQVSLHAAQALPTPDCGRGFTTVNP
jgi:hypothetical protein